MRLLSPVPSPHNAVDRRSTATHHYPAAGIVHVAVGRSVPKTLALLQWTFRHFNCKELGLIHIHQPSSMIPTLLGKLPADQANETVVAKHRRFERKEVEKILQSYQSFCLRAQVRPKIIMEESGHVKKGIVDLVVRHSIQKLVMGTASENCFKIKSRSDKVAYIAKNTPSCCQIWFIWKGKHLWTRGGSEDFDTLIPSWGLCETVLGENIWPDSSGDCGNQPVLDSEYSRLVSFPTTRVQESQSRDPCEPSKTQEVVFRTAPACSPNETKDMDSMCLDNTSSRLSLTCEKMLTQEYLSKLHGIKGLDIRLQEVMMETERSKKEALEEQAKRTELEADIAKAFNMVKASEAASAAETKIREELQNLLQRTGLEREELVRSLNETMSELENARSTFALLDGQAKELTRHCKEAAGELELMQLSIQNLQLKRSKILKEREEPISPQRLGCLPDTRFPHRDKLFGFVNDSANFTEFSASDLQTATCDFSESFKLGQGGYGCKYKGEMLKRTVVIKKLHLRNMQGQQEFDQEVSVLSRLRHPHLVSLIGSCSELLSLVYDYLPNGPLHCCLFHRNTTSPLNWKIRTRIAAQISSALLFLHTVVPERIIHGDLRPENIYLDSDFSCKIGDFGICHFVPEDTREYPMFHRNTQPKGAFPYADPERQRDVVLTPKSDVYSLGIIIMQLLTGKAPIGLTSKVRQAILADNLFSILDKTAGVWPKDVATRLATFGLQCSEMNSRLRPDLTPAIVRELEKLYLMEERPVPLSFLCPILQEIMHDPHVAADGFSYEGSAMRQWVENGRGTSPMTNLKLNHLNLTPNHALRFAIQDWLCQTCQS